MSQAHDRPTLGLEHALQALQESAEFRGPVEPADGHHCNDHLAHVFESDEEQLAAIVPFVREGLDRGERCLCLVEERSEADLRAALRAGGVAVDEAVDDGALSFPTVEETYLRDGTFDPDEMVEFYAEATAAATEEYEGLRAAVSISWLLDDGASVEAFMEYEAKVNDLFDREDVLALCQYDRRRFPPEVLRDVVRTHPHLVFRDTVCHNFYYTPPEEYLGPENPGGDVDRMLHTLLDRTEARAELEDRQSFLRRQQEITTDAGRSFEEKLEALFELGCERFGFEAGALAAVDPDCDRFEIEHVGGDGDQFAPGDELPLSETYCASVLGEAGALGVSDPRTDGFDDLAAYRDLGIESYLGMHVPVEGAHDRTFFFADSRSRSDPIPADERTFVQLLGQWVGSALERRRRERQLTGLNEASRALMDAETEAAVAEAAVEHARDGLDLPVTAVLQYDRERGELAPVAHTDRASDALSLSSPLSSGPLWESFVADKVRAVDGDALADAALTELVAAPLGQRGLFVAGTTVPGGFGARREFVETAAATVESAFTRADRERLLQEREATLEERNDRLQRLDRINTTLRSISRALVRTSTREEVEAVVCEQLTDGGPYELAWIGDRDPVSDTVVPREWAGEERGYLDERPAPDETAATNPVDAALDAREPRVVNDVMGDRSFGPWRQAALTRGYHAKIALPLCYEDSCYGVLAVYAGQPGVFDDLERSVLAELSDTIAYAINAVESKKALVGDAVTELEFATEDPAVGVAALTADLDCAFEMESVVPTPEDGLRGFFSVRGCDPETVLAAADALPVTDVELIAEREGADPEALFEGATTEECLFRAALDHGGRLQSLEAEGGRAEMTVHLATDADVRAFVDAFGRACPGAELVAQRTRERPQRTATSFRTALTAPLTDRQHEVLQTAYFSGYFEQPRPRSSREIAASLDIAQPTFTGHLRSAQRKLCRQLFEERSLTGRAGPDKQ